jgi:predicted ArsR family transcriptional regulator
MGLQRWYTAKEIAEAKNVSYQTARRWIQRLVGDSSITMTSGRRGRRKRLYRLRRLPASKLAELDRLFN